MKFKIYAILLLLSFLVVLNHEMVPHHHHDFDLAEFSVFDDYRKEYSHPDSGCHHHHDIENQKHNHSNDSEKEHKGSFPFHHHLSVENDFDCLRIELNKNISGYQPLMAVLNSFFNTTLSEPPELDFIWFTDIPFRIKTTFEPGASGLRAPPSIA